MENIKYSVARSLLSIGAVFLRPDEPFTWASGIKSPVYCDNRLTLTSPDVRDIIENAFAQVIKDQYPECDVIMGTSTAGIAHAAIAGHILKMPMGYVRGSAKDHGRVNRIEGRLNKGDKVVVIEDLISTGGSSIEAAQALTDAGAEVLSVVSIFTYGMKSADDNFNAAGYTYTSLTDFDTLIEVAVNEGYIPASSANALKAFRDNPKDDGWRNLL